MEENLIRGAQAAFRCPYPATLTQKKSAYSLRMCRTRSSAQLKPPSTAAHAVVPTGGSDVEGTGGSNNNISNTNLRAGGGVARCETRSPTKHSRR